MFPHSCFGMLPTTDGNLLRDLVRGRVQAVLNLANVVGGSGECRAQALEKGALPVVLNVFEQDLPSNMTSSVMRAALSAMYGLMIGTPQPSDKEVA